MGANEVSFLRNYLYMTCSIPHIRTYVTSITNNIVPCLYEEKFIEYQRTGRGYKTYFVLNSTEHEIYHAHKLYKHEKYNT